MVDVDDPLAAVGDEFTVHADGAELVALPLAAVGAGVLVPVGSADEVGVAVAVHVHGGDALGVVVAEAMGEKGYLGKAAGAVAWGDLVIGLGEGR